MIAHLDCVCFFRFSLSTEQCTRQAGKGDTALRKLHCGRGQSSRAGKEVVRWYNSGCSLGSCRMLQQNQGRSKATGQTKPLEQARIRGSLQDYGTVWVPVKSCSNRKMSHVYLSISTN